MVSDRFTAGVGESNVLRRLHAESLERIPLASDLLWVHLGIVALIGVQGAIVRLVGIGKEVGAVRWLQRVVSTMFVRLRCCFERVADIRLRLPAAKAKAGGANAHGIKG